ncbi:zinc finger protein 616-like isoform X3 [Spodoptera litura]|uniref:Zinc finger protein 616-like isoform X3 n=1 Tax=Spodoptera litura TaxID=69820 RepID=A0A9J7E917_SPOLT|nr:zinc finger protein 616-like isoform X3 [Spodoptera litura]
MEGQPLNCPLCCNATFSSKQSLVEHLSNSLSIISCPLCNHKSPSLPHLIDHLSQESCQSDSNVLNNINVQSIIFEHSTEDNIENSTDIGNSDIKVYENEISTNSDHQLDANEANKMYVELFTKQMKPCLETRELKLIKENGENRYMIVTQDDADLSAGNTIVTKNTDGTISLTTVKDMEMETDAMMATDTMPDETQEEIYSCNTCKVSFTSVIEHIQNYHNDQEVVVESEYLQEPIDQTENHTESTPLDYEPMDGEDPLVTPDKQTPRRVITDTGDIVEEPMLFKTDAQIVTDTLDLGADHETIKAEQTEQVGVLTKRYIQVNTMSGGVIKDIGQVNENEDDKDSTIIEHKDIVVTRRYIPVDKGALKDPIQTDAKDKIGQFHKVVVKEVPTDCGFALKTYQCLACDISVTNLDEFKIHPCKILKYPCPYCPVAYENYKSLCAHMKAHKAKTEQHALPVSYECGICNTVFLTNKSLKLHKRMHDPIKSRAIEPPVENTDGTKVSKATYRCTICNKMIPCDYKAIHQNSHKTSEKMNCGICNKKFTSLEYLEMHTSVHNVDKTPINNQDQNLPYNCLYCNRRFARPHEKVKHERIHTGEKPHSCEICGKSFRVSYCLTLHMRTHTGARPYACPHCGKRFKAHSVYNHHLLTHSEVRAYKCPFCPKAFKTSVQLAGHKNSHTKPFQCQHCNRPFASLYAVRVHTETHSRQNNLKFVCDMCGASYARAFALKDHIKQAHSQDQESEASPSPSRSIPADEDWMIKHNPDSLNKDLTHEIDLGMSGMSSNELIVP